MKTKNTPMVLSDKDLDALIAHRDKEKEDQGRRDIRVLMDMVERRGAWDVLSLLHTVGRPRPQ